MSDTELRFISSEDVEIRIDEDDEGVTRLVSHAPPWGTWSVDLGGFRERFERGAFGATGDVIATFEHDNSKVLGRTPNTLRLKDEKDGLRYEVELPDTTTGRDVAELVRRGDVRGSSFEFRVKAGGEAWSEDDDGAVTRTITDAELLQVGPVMKPAYPVGSDVALRSYEEARGNRDSEWEREMARKRRIRRLRLAEAS